MENRLNLLRTNKKKLDKVKCQFSSKFRFILYAPETPWRLGKQGLGQVNDIPISQVSNVHLEPLFVFESTMWESFSNRKNLFLIRDCS